MLAASLLDSWEMEAELRELEAEALRRVAAAGSAGELERLRIQLLGRRGRLTTAMRELGQLPLDQRPALGRLDFVRLYFQSRYPAPGLRTDPAPTTVSQP